MSKARDIADLDFNAPDIDGGNIDGAVIGGTTPAAGSFNAVTVNGPRVVVQRQNDDSSIAFANNSTGTASGNTWAIGLDYDQSESLNFAFASNGFPSLSGNKVFQMNQNGNATFNSTIATGSGGGSGKVAITGATATGEQAHATFTNTQGAKTFAIGGGQSGVTNNGFVIRNVTDNTFPLVISDAGAANFNAGLSIGGTEFITSARELTNITNLVVDGIDLGGNSVTVASGNLTLDVAGDIILDADAGGVYFKDGGTEIGLLANTGNNFVLMSRGDDKDIIFKGKDGSSTITALTLDMSAAGAATFNSSATINGGMLSIANVSTPEIELVPTGGVGNADIRFDGSSLDIRSNSSSAVLKLSTASTSRFQIAADGSLSTPTAGTSNVRFGVNAGNSIASGSTYNVLIGDEAGTAITTGDANVAIGFSALLTEDGHGFNTAVGHETLKTLNAGADAYNTAVGFRAGLSVTTGIRNTLIGGLAGDSLQDADFNVAIGSHSLTTDTLGSKSIAIGHSALEAQNFTSATDTYNIAIGDNTGFAITTGVRNVLIGALAGDAITDADKNIAIGTDALGGNKLGSRSVAIGEAALQVQNPVDGSGNDTAVDMYNTAVGHAAGNAVTTGIFNTLIGGLAGDSLTVGQENVSLGYLSLSTDTKGSHSVAIGPYALQTQNFTSATDTFNTALGYAAGNAVSTGVQNTFVGGLAGDGTDDGDSNTAVGYLALSGNAGDDNCAFGINALIACTGDANAAFGNNACLNVSSGSNNIGIGRDALRTGNPGGVQTTASNKIGLGDSNITSAHIQVDWTVASDARDKTDFTALDLGLDFVKALAPVTYKWDKRAKYGDKYAEDYDLNAQTPDGTHKEDWLDIGFKAQEVEALEIAAGYNKDNKTTLVSSHTDDGKQMGLQYSKFVPILVKAIQEQNALIESLTARITTLEG